MVHNFFSDIPVDLSAEVFEKLAVSSNVTIERIISHGQSTPAGQWYDQTQHEFVILLKGEAALEFAQGELVILTPGDYLTILPHQKHRVASTSTHSETLWLAVFYD
ncbi:cupin domain-containing protein [Shewanella sp. CG12_big_fil_rev_8_21_14_0_65_47_15]|uniref:cupin domain-containing protein n=1 Tax=Shewanella sp. CG12_big_fil_rev_8_21_14_0_65_47_15 TaxID=1975537 RepID=UPI000CAB6B05|nr:cupin domain-containing protein [Shewanella sp. CG12_big_fil_rev_8_21_14_0_65_47_15]PIW62014.1 MAG: cupin [Shewanella sp. CG12_big_fil_rev_8_21_14_0_65_47_15]